MAEHREEDFWAWDALMSAAVDDPERAWAVVLTLIQLARDEQLGYVGAAPLEDILQNHGAAFVDRAEQLAASDPRFRECLAAIWLNRRYLEPALVDRLVAASGGRILVSDIDHDEMDRLYPNPEDYPS